jgi:hypothetical protein
VDALVHKRKGIYEMVARDYAGAVATFDRALALWPDNREIQASVCTTRAIFLGTGFAPRWSAFASRAWVPAPGAPGRGRPQAAGVGVQAAGTSKKTRALFVLMVEIRFSTSANLAYMMYHLRFLDEQAARVEATIGK